VSDPLLGVIFVVSAATSLGASWGLVVSLERVGARVGLSEALLGMLAALAADAPEITASITALAHHDQRIGAGVVIGSNVFNLAALIGLAAFIAGQIALHRRVIELAGAVALWIAIVTVMVVTGVLSPVAGLTAVIAVFAPYLAVLGIRDERLTRLRLPAGWTRWLIEAVHEEELELEPAIHPRRGGTRDALIATGAIVVVVSASIAMERTASKLGARHSIPPIVVGGLVLAGVTSLPNAVAGVYLALRGRGAAVLSTALNSNALNIIAGLLIPTTFVGVGAPSAETTFVAGSYLAMTMLVLALGYIGRGLRRAGGAAIVLAYLVFVVVLLVSA
jgi:cation:H+ antiporter